jgi:hypothetical protein
MRLIVKTHFYFFNVQTRTNYTLTPTYTPSTYWNLVICLWRLDFTLLSTFVEKFLDADGTSLVKFKSSPERLELQKRRELPEHRECRECENSQNTENAENARTPRTPITPRTPRTPSTPWLGSPFSFLQLLAFSFFFCQFLAYFRLTARMCKILLQYVPIFSAAILGWSRIAAQCRNTRSIRGTREDFERIKFGNCPEIYFTIFLKKTQKSPWTVKAQGTSACAFAILRSFTERCYSFILALWKAVP